MTENQKLRESLQAYERVRESLFRHCLSNGVFNAWGKAFDCLALNDAHLLAKSALALPTADHLPDAGEMIQTAAPVGERELFEKWAREQFYSGLACPSDTWSDERKTYNDAAHYMAFCAFKAATQITEQAAHEEIARLRTENAALSAGDAVDAQRYRWLVSSESDVNKSRSADHQEAISNAWEALQMLSATKESVDAAIDAAMRKGQL